MLPNPGPGTQGLQGVSGPQGLQGVSGPAAERSGTFCQHVLDSASSVLRSTFNVQSVLRFEHPW